MPKVLFVGDIHADGHRLFDSRSGFERVLMTDPKPADLLPIVPGVDAIVLRKLNLSTDILDAAQRLKVVSRHGVGCDNIDVDALTQRGIPVMTVGDGNSISVAEHAMMLMLATARRLPACMDLVRSPDSSAERERFLIARDAVGTMELAGRTLLIIGFGRVGRRLAKLASAFDMELVVADPFVDAGAAEALGYRHVERFENAIGDADCIALCLPAAPGGQPLFQAREFAAMKQGAVFINVARGSLVNEKDLAEAVQRGHLLGAGTDVWQQLPPGPDHPLLSGAGVIATPHCAAHTGSCLGRMAEISVQNVFDYFDGALKRGLCFNPEAVSWAS